MIYSGITQGIGGRIVTITSAPGTGPIAGMTENASRECLVRVRASLANDEIAEVARVRINVALTSAVRFEVSGSPDTSSGCDLPVALEALRAAGAPLPADLLAIGQLSLGGHIRPVRGVLPVLLAGYAQGLRVAVIPDTCVSEAVLAQRAHPDLRVCVASSVVSAVAQLVSGRFDDFVIPSQPPVDLPTLDDLPDAFEQVRREVREAVAQRKPLLLIGDKGAPITMIVRRIVRLLPPMTARERLTVACTASAAGLPVHPYMERPLRAPHHTASSDAILGSRALRPGELTLANHGVLYLDDLTEFRRSTLDNMGLAIAKGSISYRRPNEANVEMPTKPYLVASMTPCPCGVTERCVCTTERKVAHYARTLPLLSHFTEVHVPRLTTAEVYPART